VRTGQEGNRTEQWPSGQGIYEHPETEKQGNRLGEREPGLIPSASPFLSSLPFHKQGGGLADQCSGSNGDTSKKLSWLRGLGAAMPEAVYITIGPEAGFGK
jgi:hypothetical protein